MIKEERNDNEKNDNEKNDEKIKPLIVVDGITKIYKSGIDKVVALNNVSFEIYEGEIVTLLGSSGSGKSTLLNIMAGIERTTKGKVLIKEKNICKFDENKLAKFRQKYLGFVFQSYNLINSYTALENVELPLIFKRIDSKTRKNMAYEFLCHVGLKERIKHKPTEMSGGQQQRVGIARAFVSKPKIVFADEPTGNLDSKTAVETIKLIKKMARENNETIIIVTHDPNISLYADKIIEIHDGEIIDIRKQEKPLE